MRNFRYLVILFLVSLFLMGCKIVDTQVTTSTTTEATTTADTTTTTEEIPKTIPTGDIQYELTKDQLKIQATLTDPDKIVTYVSITLESDEDLKTLTSEKDRIFNNKSNLSYTFNKLNKNTTYTLSMIVDYQDESQKKEDVVLVSHEITTEIWTSGKILNPENKKGEITFDVQLDDPDSNTDYYILLKLFNTTVDERKLDDLSSTNNYISNLKFDNIFILPNYPYQIVLISSSETINNQIDVYHFYPNLYVTIPSVGLQNTVIDKDKIELDLEFTDPDEVITHCLISLYKGETLVESQSCWDYYIYIPNISFTELEKNTDYFINVNLHYSDGKNVQMKDINLYEFTTVYWGPEATVKNPLIDQGTITFDLELNDTGEDILDCFIRLNKDGNNIENQSCDELNMNGNNKDLFFTGLEKNTSYEIAVYLLYYHEEIIESVSTYEFTTGTWLDKPTAMLENPVLNKEEISFDITFIDPDKSFIDCTIILLKGNLKVSDNYCSGHPPYENKDLNYTLGFSTLEKNTAYTIFINIDYTDGANNREYEHKLYEFTTGSWLATPKARFSSDPYIEGNTIYFTPNVTDVDNTLTKLTYAIMQGDIIIEEWIPLEHEWPYTVERFYTGIVENVLYQVVVKADFYDGEEHKSVILARYDLMKVPIDTTVSGSLDRVNPKDKYYFSIEEDQVINFTIQSELGVIAELYDVNKKQYVYIPSNYDKHNANFSVHLEAGTYSIRIMADYNYIAEYDFSIEPSASQ